MTILGADPDHLQSTASRLLTHADGYDNACNHIGLWLRRMDWQGPEADRFRASFESQIRPQLDTAAAFLRETAAELRVQAAAQARASGSVGGIFSGIESVGLPIFVPDGSWPFSGLLKDIYEVTKNPIGLPSLFRHLDADWGFDVAKRFSNTLIPGSGIHLAKTLTKFFGVVAIPFLAVDVYEFSRDILAVDWQDQDSLEQLLYSGSDVLMGVGTVAAGLAVMLGMAAPPLAAIVVGVGLAIKTGTFIIDNWDSISNGIESAYDFTVDVIDSFIEDPGGFLGGVAEGTGEFLGGVAEGTGEFLGGVAEGTGEFLEGVAGGISGFNKGVFNGVRSLF